MSERQTGVVKWFNNAKGFDSSPSRTNPKIFPSIFVYSG